MSEDLKRRAEVLGVRVDGRWSDDRLKEEINQAEMAKGLRVRQVEAEKGDEGVPPPKDQGRDFANTSHVRIRINKGYWPADGSPKVLPGEIAELRVAEAKDVVAKGIGEVAFPFGEDEEALTPPPAPKAQKAA